jgi:hypothetical protein
MRLFQVYSAGNFIEATPETPYFQVGESKYGKPVLDRVITPDTPLDEAAKCALVSMDSTLKSNLSVGLPLDMVVYEADKLPDRPRDVHRRPQPLLPDAAWQLGPEAARGVRQHRRSDLGWRRDQRAADGLHRAQQAAPENHLTTREVDLSGSDGGVRIDADGSGKKATPAPLGSTGARDQSGACQNL